MKRFFPLLLCVLLLLSGCTGFDLTSSTSIQMEIMNNYDASDPFVNEQLLYVDENVDVLELEVSFLMEGESGILEIADNETKQVIWSDSWDGNVDETKFTVSLDTIEKEKEYVIRFTGTKEKEKEYVIRFTGTKIKYAKISITSEDNLVKEREKPLKPDIG